VALDDVSRRLADVRGSTERLLAWLRDPPRDEVHMRQPSLLPGWTRAHVLAHLARNADAIGRTLQGALRGERVPMYASEDERAADIEAGARQTARALVDDVQASAERLDETFARMTPESWERPSYTRAGARSARSMIGSRWREVEIHRVDLDDGYGPGDWPAAFVAPLLPSLVDPDRLAPRLPPDVTVDITDTDSGRRWSVDSAAGGGTTGRLALRVTGPSWALVCWLVGRPSVVRRELGEPPPLTPWA
jgi:maleylpyruvate isomerase